MIRRPPRSTLLSLHDALPICPVAAPLELAAVIAGCRDTSAPWEPSSGGSTAHERRQQHAVRTPPPSRDRKSTRLNSSHLVISYAVFCLKKKRRLTPYQHSSPA